MFFGRKTKKEVKEETVREVRKGLLFWLPGGSSRLDVYMDYCVMRCLGKTKLEEKERVIPFSSITDVVYTPASPLHNASLQIFTKEMPDVKRSHWYPYENNMVVVHPTTDELAHTVQSYLLNPKGSNVVPPEYLDQIKREIKQEQKEKREKEEKEKQEQEEKERKAKQAERERAKQERAKAAAEAAGEEVPPEDAAPEDAAAEDTAPEAAEAPADDVKEKESADEGKA